MSAHSVTLAGQRAAESRMGAPNGGSTVTVRRMVTLDQQDDATGAMHRWEIVASESPGRIPPKTTYREVEVGGERRQMAVRQWHAPAATAGDWADGDHIEVTAGACEGRVFRVLESTPADQATAHRMDIIETARPTAWG